MFTVKFFDVNGHSFIYIKELNRSFFLKDINKINYDKTIYTKQELLEILQILDVESEEYLELERSICNYKAKKYDPDNYIDKKHIMYTLCMHPSRKCNLSCKYCFADNKCDSNLPEKNIDINLAKKAIDFLVDDYGKEAYKYRIDLSGSGEPFLNFNFIKEIDKYCSEKSSKIGKSIKIMFPTNATLINEDIAQYIENTKNLFLGVSLDGSKEQSVHRRLKNGDIAFEKIMEGINKIDRTYGVSVTVTHENEDVDNIVDYMYENLKNADAVSMQFVREYDLERECSFWNIDNENVIKHYEILAENIIDHIKKEDYDYLYFVIRGADAFGRILHKIIKEELVQLRYCGAGMNVLSVDDKGKLYACSVFNGDSNFAIGDIYNGVERNKQMKYCENNIIKNDKCSKCWCSFICGGECMAQSYLANKEINKPIDKLCDIKMRFVELALYISMYLKKYYTEAYEKIKSFKIDEALLDDSAWAMNYFLKANGLHIEYNELEEFVYNNQPGVNPQKMGIFMKNKGIDVKGYIINKEYDLNDVQYPIIMLKKYEHKCSYVIISGKENGLYEIKLINSGNEKILMDYEQMLEKFHNFYIGINNDC